MMPPLRISTWLLALAATVLISATGGAASAKENEDGWLGVTMQDLSSSMSEALQLESSDGVLIDSVVEDSPAKKAGLEDGDVILEFGDSSIEDTADLARMVRKTSPGDEVDLTIMRDGARSTLTVTIGEREDDWPRIAFQGQDGVKLLRKMPRGGRALRWQHGQPGKMQDIYINRFFGDHGYLGVSLQGLGEQLGDYFGVEDGEGALITEVMEETPAAEAGLQAGDVIVKIDDEEVESPGDITSHLQDTEAGDEVTIEVLRDKRSRSFTITLAEAPDDANVLSLHDEHLWIPKQGRNFRFFPHGEGGEDLHFEFKHDDDSLDEMKEELDEMKDQLRQMQKELQELRNG